MGRGPGVRGAQEEPLRRLSAGHSALVTNNTDPFVIEQLHKLELAAGAGPRLNNGGMKSKEASQATDSVQLQVGTLSCHQQLLSSTARTENRSRIATF